MRTRSFTVLLTLAGTILCLVHYLFHDFDSIYLLFYALSVPAWFTPVITNVYEISLAKMIIIYILTIASWALIGFTIDRFTVINRRNKRKSH